jgi:hypothetical protein
VDDGVVPNGFPFRFTCVFDRGSTPTPLFAHIEELDGVEVSPLWMTVLVVPAGPRHLESTRFDLSTVGLWQRDGELNAIRAICAKLNCWRLWVLWL